MVQATALVSTTDGEYRVANIEVGRPRADEVLVELYASGVCHTDADMMRRGRPVILGHEGAGIVRERGERVRHVDVGDRVLLNWAIPCRECHACVRGSVHLCERHSPVVAGEGGEGHAHAEGTLLDGEPITRSFQLGTMSTWTLVKGAAVVPIGIEIPFSSACVVGCGVMTGYGSVVNAARVTAGTSVVVIGCGGVGLNVVQAARISGAAQIVAVDLSPHRLQLAQQFGATDTLQAHRDDAGLALAAEAVRAMFGGRGADYAFECTANPALGAAPLAMVRNSGMAIQVSGIEQDLTIDMNLFEWDKIYLNPLYGQCRPDIDFARIFDLYARGELLLDELVSKVYPMANLGQAFEDMHAGAIAKGVLDLQSAAAG